MAASTADGVTVARARLVHRRRSTANTMRPTAIAAIGKPQTSRVNPEWRGSRTGERRGGGRAPSSALRQETLDLAPKDRIRDAADVLGAHAALGVDEERFGDTVHAVVHGDAAGGVERVRKRQPEIRDE